MQHDAKIQAYWPQCSLILILILYFTFDGFPVRPTVVQEGCCFTCLAH
uniref:Uncharacterized protein n=1 Tax=Anguilla anguilla TaxID=7936 RepID=A0A0E9SQJ4_ANGAN